MTVRVVIPSALRKWTGGKEAIEVEAPGDGVTVGEVFAIISPEYPGIRQRVLDDQGQIRRHVNVLVDGENVRLTSGLGTTLRPNSEVHIFPALSGGV